MSEFVDGALAPDRLRSMDPICDAFDIAWGQGQRPAIEDRLRLVEGPIRPALLAELVQIELEWRMRQGDTPLAEEYCARFPSCAESIAEWLKAARSAAEALSSSTAPDTAHADSHTDPGDGNQARMAAAPPQVLGEYELLEPLGAGGMGEVYRARHRRLDKQVALKLLPALARQSPERVARFVREAKAVGNLDHPNVVEALDAGEQAGVVFLVMKLIDGTDLSALVKERGPLPVAEAGELARQTAVGLEYLHEHGLIHRDLKPSNVMRTPDGTVKILDLGLARLRQESTPGDDLTGTGDVMGTPDYLAPEQIRGTAPVDSRADLYGLGGTLFFLLTGRAPFAHHLRAYEKLKAHEGEPPPAIRKLRPDVPDELASLVHCLLAKEPADRPQTAGAVAVALEAFAAAGTAATTVTFVAPAAPGKKAPRRRWLLAGAAALVLGLGLAGALFLLQPWKEAALPPTNPGHAPAPQGDVPLQGLDIKHFERSKDGMFETLVGLLGKESFSTHRGDGLTLEARLSRPAFAYVIAFRPDGVEELVFPEREEVAPPLTDRPRYPSVSRNVHYGLDDGEGLQVFAVVASTRPLPAYDIWRAQRTPSPWRKLAAPPGVVWWNNGSDTLALTHPSLQRSKGRQTNSGSPVDPLTQWLLHAPGVEAVGTLGFAVLPRQWP